MALFENAQWKVTKDALESKEPFGYYIGAAQLLVISNRRDGGGFDWPAHMAAKRWVKVELFLEAFWMAAELQADKCHDDLDL